MTADLAASPLIPVPLKRAEARHRAAARVYQGIPGVAVTEKGRLFAVWYGGGTTEGPENYVMIALSDDGGHSWYFTFSSFFRSHLKNQWGFVS